MNISTNNRTSQFNKVQTLSAKKPEVPAPQVSLNPAPTSHAPLDKVTTGFNAAPQTSESLSAPQPESTPAPATPPHESRSTQLLESLKTVDRESRAKILTEYLGATEGHQYSEEQKEGLLAVATLNHSTREIRKRMPGASKKEIRQAAEGNKELKNWTDLADQSASILKERKAASGPVDPQKQAEEMREAKAKMERIRAIYSDLHSSMAESAQKRLQIMRETNAQIAEIMKATREQGQTLAAEQRGEWNRINLGSMVKGSYVF